MKAYDVFASCELAPSNAFSCDLRLVIKQTNDKTFYVGLAQIKGITFITVNGFTKTLLEILND